MSPEAQRIAIAEACGIVIHDHWGPLYKTPKGIVRVCPDYLGDLNAMHEAQKVLTYEQAEEFVEQLYLADQKNNLAENPPPWRFNVASATAAQRAEAFLRTIGKWEEAK